MNMTWKEVYTAAKVNASTSAFQRERFLEFFPHINEGRQRRYNEKSVEVLILTSSMYSGGKTYEDIKDVLEKGVAILPQPEDDSKYVVQQMDIKDIIRQVFQEEMEQRDATILKLQGELASVKEALLKIEGKSLEMMEAISARYHPDNSRSVERGVGGCGRR